MGLEKNSHQVGVQDYFVNKKTNKTALECDGDLSNADYSGFDSNLYKYLNEKSISEMIKVNSEITKVLSKFKVSININMNILSNLVQNHLPHTKNIALGIANYIPKKFQSKINRKALTKATYLHDIAKVIMPENIINKPGVLTEDERKIMSKHADLSYEMLKTTDLDIETLNLIKNHHSHSPKTTNPIENENHIDNINLQILSMADIYSALREKRCYKDALSKEKALEIISKEVEKGKFHSCVYKALVEYAKNEEKTLSKKDSKWKIFNLKPINSLST